MCKKEETTREASLQLKRLKRHYDNLIMTYDEISLLDFAASLRIWTELQESLAKEHVDFKTKQLFKSARLRKPIMKLANSHQYIFICLPKDGTYTCANAGYDMTFPDIDDNDFSVFTPLKYEGKTNRSVLRRGFYYINKYIDPSDFKSLFWNEITIKLNFITWMSDSIVRMQFVNSNGIMEKHSLSRATIIKRVANVYGADHPKLKNDKDSPNNKYDEPVRWLMDFRCGGLPLPYFILLKIARDIIENVPKLLKIESLN